MTRFIKKPWGLFKTSIVVLIVLAIFAAAVWIGLGWLLGSKWPWLIPAGDDTNRYTILRMVLFIGAGAVGVVGVTVAFRRQLGIEEGQFLEHLAASAAQLGDENPTVQAAGIYALAGLADRSPPIRRQQCVDVLCAYLRLPYVAAEQTGEPGVTTSITRKHTVTTETGSVEQRNEEQRTVSLRPHDREVRHTIIRVITQHLQSKAAASWSNLNFDFTGVVFDGGDFSKAVFRGEAIFVGATFSGGTVDFGGATFSGGTVDFGGATFSGGDINFRNCKFSGMEIDFQNARFTGGAVSFGFANFSGVIVDFRYARFAGGIVYFRYAKLSGRSVYFSDAQFSGGIVDFREAKFTGKHILFTNTRFSRGSVNFDYANFSRSIVHYCGALFTHGKVQAWRSRFKKATVRFLNNMYMRTKNRSWARLIYGVKFRLELSSDLRNSVSFYGAKFCGTEVSFKDAKFTGGSVDFGDPGNWSTPPRVDWGDGDSTPLGVHPDRWPPSLRQPRNR